MSDYEPLKESEKRKRKPKRTSEQQLMRIALNNVNNAELQVLEEGYKEKIIKTKQLFNELGL